ncbi:MAG: tRNA uridine-5-carboxymethylaminomethyl(34) synthesis GTPase MnmE [Candidatus Omnitrophica bacterium]|nr:tRNA uridine-5-carboxymethylaminomethyl(34) synthesis GTPase MnmE [Candidatus Omnitrophota bacterium]
MNEDTIAAIATPIGEGGISIIRLSGPQAFEIAEKIFQPLGRQAFADFPSHTVHLGNILEEHGEVLDQVLVTVFRHPNSYTGENLVEISSHGGLVITKKILSRFLAQGARPAEPGEFTKRAFLNGKMDLAQAEAVLDLIKAKSDRSAQTAIRQLTGSLSRKFKVIKDELMMMYAHMEAFLDFPDDDLEIFSDEKFTAKFSQVQKEIEKLIAGFSRGSLIREGASLVLIGKPNVGKSSLFNALLARDRALVSEFPGTTRDILEEAIEIQGWYLRLFDTAGLASQAENPVEAMGMERTLQIMEQASLFLFLVDGSQPLDEKDSYVFNLIPKNKIVIPIMNKTDLGLRANEHELKKLLGGNNKLGFPAVIPSEAKDLKAETLHGVHSEPLHSVQDDKQKNHIVKISTKEREGLELLEKQIAAQLAQGISGEEGEQITRLRHKVALERALEALKRSAALFHQRESLEMVIEDLKSAIHELRELIGEVYSEDLLDVIFSKFCIGK